MNLILGNNGMLGRIVEIFNVGVSQNKTISNIQVAFIIMYPATNPGRIKPI